MKIFRRFGKETTLAAIRQDQEETAEFIRRKTLDMIPPGTYSTRDYMDNDGVGDEWHSFHLELSRTDDNVSLDATKSDDQAPGSINFIASDGTIGAYFGQHFHQYDPSLTMNEGLLAAVDEVKLRRGSILQPQWPAALGCRAHTFTKLKNAVRAVVAKANGGDTMAAMAVYVIAYWRMKDAETGEWLLCTDGIAVGHGARPQADGIDAVYSRHNENYPAEFYGHGVSSAHGAVRHKSRLRRPRQVPWRLRHHPGCPAAGAGRHLRPAGRKPSLPCLGRRRRKGRGHIARGPESGKPE